MLLILIAVTASAAPHADASPPTEAPPCVARAMAAHDRVMPFGWGDAALAQAALLSKIMDPEADRPQRDILPPVTPQRKGPAVLQPECKVPEPPRKREFPKA